MKQHITPEQINELSFKAKKAYEEWYKSHFDIWSNRIYVYEDENGVTQSDLPLLSIGQMIEFLYDHRPIKGNKTCYLPESFGDEYGLPYPEEMCDDLWEAVKEKLNA